MIRSYDGSIYPQNDVAPTPKRPKTNDYLRFSTDPQALQFSNDRTTVLEKIWDEAGGPTQQQQNTSQNTADQQGVVVDPDGLNHHQRSNNRGKRNGATLASPGNNTTNTNTNPNANSPNIIGGNNNRQANMKSEIKSLKEENESLRRQVLEWQHFAFKCLNFHNQLGRMSSQIVNELPVHLYSDAMKSQSMMLNSNSPWPIHTTTNTTTTNNGFPLDAIAHLVRESNASMSPFQGTRQDGNAHTMTGMFSGQLNPSNNNNNSVLGGNGDPMNLNNMTLSQYNPLVQSIMEKFSPKYSNITPVSVGTAFSVAKKKGLQKSLAAVCGEQMNLNPLTGNLTGGKGSMKWDATQVSDTIKYMTMLMGGNAEEGKCKTLLSDWARRAKEKAKNKSKKD